MEKRLFTLLVILGLLVLIIKFSNNLATQVLGFNTRAGLKVISTPAAEVFLDGERLGKTPFDQGNFRPGDYNLKLVSGDNNWEGNVRLNGGTFSVVNREIDKNVVSSSGEILTLNPGSGVVITSVPSNAQVEIDGQSFGTTPLSVPGLKVGEHTFLISHDNYLKRSIKAILPDKMSLNLGVELAKEF